MLETGSHCEARMTWGRGRTCLGSRCHVRGLEIKDDPQLVELEVGKPQQNLRVFHGPINVVD